MAEIEATAITEVTRTPPWWAPTRYAEGQHEYGFSLAWHCDHLGDAQEVMLAMEWADMVEDADDNEQPPENGTEDRDATVGATERHGAAGSTNLRG